MIGIVGQEAVDGMFVCLENADIGRKFAQVCWISGNDEEERLKACVGAMCEGVKGKSAVFGAGAVYEGEKDFIRVKQGGGDVKGMRRILA